MVFDMSFLNKLMFSLWYLRKPPWDTKQTPPEVQDYIENHLPGKALDLGCGTGTNAITLAKNGWQVIGIDFVSKAIRTARKKAKQAQVDIDFRVDDVTKLSGVEETFDLILDIGCYHNLDANGMKAYRSNINRLLGNNGTFLLYTFFRNLGSKSQSGVAVADIEAFSPPLILISRMDGLERGSRPASWLTYRKDEGG
jgi:2-polyprenyl-3-methyl-5-hydroxy-6-metoxy-1,4-benzoquinol methylase